MTNKNNIFSDGIRIIYEDENFLVADKPAGIPTHAPNGQTMGLVEILSAQKGIRLGVHQRLDAATSGVIAFSKTPQGAARLAKAFELRNIKKTYRALVCGSPCNTEGEWSHTLLHINGKTEENTKGKTARSTYRIIAKIGPFSLLELRLLTGLTHQLRAQCAIEGCPILGDPIYGGGDLYPRLCLHAQRLHLLSEPNLPAFNAKLPACLDKVNLNIVFGDILAAVHRQIGSIPEDEAVRILAPQHSGIPEIIAEKLGRNLLIRHLEPEQTSVWDVSALKSLIYIAKKEFSCAGFCYRVHESPSKRRACRALAQAFSEIPEPYTARENGIAYHFDLSGNATGLYLDQRENRQWIAEHAHGSVINLFAYTCAFSVCAASNPDVTATTSVDSAASALKRGRANFELNKIALEGHRFITEDAMKYLARCAQNGTRFDTVICDPPSFGRAGKAVFSLEDELEKLLALCVQTASPGAVFLFSLNHRKIRLPKLRAAWKNAVRYAPCPPSSVEIFVNDDTASVLGVGTDLKTIRCRF